MGGYPHSTVPATTEPAPSSPSETVSPCGYNSPLVGCFWGAALSADSPWPPDDSAGLSVALGVPSAVDCGLTRPRSDSAESRHVICLSQNNYNIQHNPNQTHTTNQWQASSPHIQNNPKQTHTTNHWECEFKRFPPSSCSSPLNEGKPTPLPTPHPFHYPHLTLPTTPTS